MSYDLIEEAMYGYWGAPDDFMSPEKEEAWATFWRMMDDIRAREKTNFEGTEEE
jgi:hypothetical protein